MRKIIGARVATCLVFGLGSIQGPVFADPSATALPTGGQVAAGQVDITQSGSQMNLLQSSDQAVVNWQSFDIGQYQSSAN